MPGPRRLLAAARILGAFASGAAVGAAFPPIDQIELMPLGIAGLLLLVRHRRGRTGFLYGWAFGFGFMLVLLPWLHVIGYDAWVILSALEALYYGLIGLSWAEFSRYRWWPPAAAASWVGAELLRGTVPFGGLPWGRLAFGLVQTPFDRYGRLGGTALVSFVAVLVVGLVVDAATRRRRMRTVALEVVGAAALVLVSFVLPVGLAGPSGRVTVAAVQGNVPGVGLDAFAERRAVVRNHAQATEAFAARVDAGRAPRPNFVLWPENSTDIDPFDTPQVYREIQQAVSAVGVPVVVGAVLDGPDADHVQNVGIVWSPTSGPGERYVKQHLVPFGEYIPFRGFFTKFITRLEEIPKDFAPGHRVGRLTVAGTPVGDLICFEVAYDGLARSIEDAGGRLIVVQTNNATYAGTGQLAQQFAISRYRAIEAGREVAIASTDGISGFISPSGDVQSMSKVRTRAVLERRVWLGDAITPGIRIGFWVDLVLSVAALLLACGAIVGNRRRTRRMVA
jgi:apolipoprotein N-acyltransferase